MANAQKRKYDQEYEQRPEVKARRAIYAKRRKQVNWARAIVVNSLRTDRMKKRSFSIQDYIDEDFVHSQLQQQDEKCIYCQNHMEFGEGVSRAQQTGLTIQRLNNDIAHIKSNCVLCCLRCNVMSAAPGHEIMMRYGLGLFAGTLRYCTHNTHIGDRIVDAAKFSTVYCKTCQPLYVHEYRQIKKAIPMIRCNRKKHVGERKLDPPEFTSNSYCKACSQAKGAESRLRIGKRNILYCTYKDHIGDRNLVLPEYSGKNICKECYRMMHRNRRVKKDPKPLSFCKHKNHVGDRNLAKSELAHSARCKACHAADQKLYYNRKCKGESMRSYIARKDT